MSLEPPTPEPQEVVRGCLFAILGALFLLGFTLFAIAGVIVTVQWALGR
jgi:hypothetical protein